MTVRLATGASITLNYLNSGIFNILVDKQNDDLFKVLDLDDKSDGILGLPRLRRYMPSVRWRHRFVKMPDD